MKDINKKKDPNSILNLSIFSSNLLQKEKDEIMNNIINYLSDDYVLFRDFNDKILTDEMDNNFTKFISDFSSIFNMSLSLKKKFSQKNDLRISLDFLRWLKNLKINKLTALFKLTGLSKSIILSYFFIKKKISCKRFTKLVNIEYYYQQKKWGKVDEHNQSNLFFLEAVENIECFLKLTKRV